MSWDASSKVSVKAVGSAKKYSDLCERVTSLTVTSKHTPPRRTQGSKEQAVQKQSETVNCAETISSQSSGCDYYISNNERHSDVPTITTHDLKRDVTVKANKHKHNIALQCDWSGEEIFRKLSSSLRIPLDRLKLIHKGRLLTPDSVAPFVKSGALFQALGEECADERGLSADDIDVIMRRMSVDRNAAVSALRQHSNLLDALLFLGNTSS